MSDGEDDELSMYGKAIRDAAIELLRCHHGLDESYQTMNGCCERLREAIGISVEELRESKL